MPNLFELLLGKLLPVKRRASISNRHETPNVSTSATVNTIQSAIRSAEAGDTLELFALYRDITVSGSHVQTELSKRKLAVLGDATSIQPRDKNNPDDQRAARAIQRMIDDCENWEDGLIHLMDSVLWPVAVVEKIFAPADNRGQTEALRFTLKRIEIVNPQVLCFRERPALPGHTEIKVPEWEPDLRFYETQGGRVVRDVSRAYDADPIRHIVHRGHLLTGIRDNWGGPMRSIVFWWLLSALGRDWFGRGMERWGSPFVVGRTDTSSQEKVDFLKEQFSLSTKIGGLVVDQETQIELEEIAATGLADAHEKFINVCNREISKLILGQTLSSEAQSTGLQSSVGGLQSEVRQDLRAFDAMKLSTTLTRQLFRSFLRINGLPGRVPKVVWGGESKEEAELSGDLLQSMAMAGLRPTDEALGVLSQKFGFALERAPIPVGGGAGPAPFSAGRLVSFNAGRAVAEFVGVPRSWLAPVANHLREIEDKVRDQNLSDADLELFLARANARLPEIFESMDVDALAKVFEAGMGGAVMDGLREGLGQD